MSKDQEPVSASNIDAIKKLFDEIKYHTDTISLWKQCKLRIHVAGDKYKSLTIQPGKVAHTAILEDLRGRISIAQRQLKQYGIQT